MRIEKNRILARGSQKKSSLKMISKPKGTIGQKGYSLIEHMRLNPEDEEQKGLYNDILVSPLRNCGLIVPKTVLLRPPFEH
jgi:hypothetical protein